LHFIERGSDANKAISLLTLIVFDPLHGLEEIAHG